MVQAEHLVEEAAIDGAQEGGQGGVRQGGAARGLQGLAARLDAHEVQGLGALLQESPPDACPRGRAGSCSVERVSMPNNRSRMALRRVDLPASFGPTMRWKSRWVWGNGTGGR